MALSIPQENLREEYKLIAHSQDIPFVSTFDKTNTLHEVRNIYKVAQQEPSLKPIFGKINLINCRRQPKNLKQMLTSAAFKEGKENFSITICRGPRCQVCNFIIEGESFKFHQQIFYVNAHMNCNVKTASM